jgi:hypothetical protein
MRPALDPAGHRVPRTKPTCLLHTWRPHQQRPFALVLHLHQHESSRSLHLQYLAKNQSTQRCQSLITQGSDHPPVLEPHMVLNLTATRPDIQFSVCLCAHFQASQRTPHRQAVKRIFRHLRHTPDFGLWYSTSSSLALHIFSDADFVGCWLDRKSTSGTCQFLGSSLVSWSSHKQSSVAQSTTEAEYVAATSCSSQLLWITYTMSHFNVIAQVP